MDENLFLVYLHIESHVGLENSRWSKEIQRTQEFGQP